MNFPFTQADYGIKDQLNLFEMLAPKKDNTLEVIAEWFCDEFNLLNTQWKNTNDCKKNYKATCSFRTVTKTKTLT